MVMSTHCPLKELFIIQRGTLGALRYGMHGLLNVRQRPVLIISVMFTDIKGPVFFLGRRLCVCVFSDGCEAKGTVAYACFYQHQAISMSFFCSVSSLQIQLTEYLNGGFLRLPACLF